VASVARVEATSRRICERAVREPQVRGWAASSSATTWLLSVSQTYVYLAGLSFEMRSLTIQQVSEFAEENDLREIFERHGRVTRVFLAKDRETGRAKGFAFVSYADRTDAARACERVDGYGFGHLILRVEFAKKADEKPK
jgi:hypothetical protein